MKKRLLAILMVLAVLALILSACSKNSAQTETDTLENKTVSSVQGMGEEGQQEDTESEKSDETGNQKLITITAGNQVFEGVLADSKTAEVFADMLPMTLSMQRVGGGREFYGGMENALPYDRADAQTYFENGDIAFWLGGDGLCLLYNDQVEDKEISAGIVVFGKIISDLSGFHDLDSNIEVTIELAH